MSEQSPGAYGEFEDDLDEDSLDIAIVGMSGRFPKAGDIDAFWRNLKAGECAVTRFDKEDLAARGVDPRTLDDPRFVRAGYPLEGSETFDAAFFGYSPREAELMDPQHRVLLECAWEALESAGHAPGRYDGLVGVYAGAGHNTYLLFNIGTRPGAHETMSDKELVIGNRPDFLSSRVSYKLGLEGPSVTVQSACSTSLVAVVQACQSLLAYQCDMALAGGVSVDGMRRNGYLYSQDGILSPDGLCRTFDVEARGTVGGDGVGMVVLKRLKDAITDNDHIHAIIKGAAVNNDGANRAGFSAPSAVTQAKVISTALANADVAPESIRYLEVHGSATALGDPIEVAALTAAYEGVPTGHCALGSVKSNIGHLDSAAGVAGLIKTVLAVEHGQIPPSLHFTEPNPRLGLADSPFHVNTELRPWPEGDGPRRAAVSSFGLGGTNAHVVLEQAPQKAKDTGQTAGIGQIAGIGQAADQEQLLVLSAKTPEALESATDRLLTHLRAHPGQSLPDIAFTLRDGRSHFPYRRTLVCADTDDAIGALEARDDGRLLSGTAPDVAHRPVGFMFTGFGAHFPGMARGLYAREPAFRNTVDRCASLLEPLLGQDIRPLMLTADTGGRPAAEGGAQAEFRQMLLQPERGEHPLDEPRPGHAALFTLEYALVALWDAWGVRPDAMIGHSLGEYVAACAAGVFSLPDALRFVVERATLIEKQGEGAMLAVPLAEEEARRYTSDDLHLAALNGPQTSVLSGTLAAVEHAAHQLRDAGLMSRRLTSRHAFHSPVLDPVVAPCRALLQKIRLSRPTVPFISNVSGTWITDEEATSPDYWAEHVRTPVRFADGLHTLWGVPDIALVEIGPGQTLTTGALQHPAGSGTDRTVVPSLPGPFESQSDRATMLRAAGRLWLAGREDPFPRTEGGTRVQLPTYPFERRTYWLEPDVSAPTTSSAPRRHHDVSKWFYAPSWQRLPAATAGSPAALAAHKWLVFADETGVGSELALRLADLGADVRTVAAGDTWAVRGEDGYVVDPAQPEHYARLAAALRADGALPDRVVHCWGIGHDADRTRSAEDVAGLLRRSYDSLVRWAQAAEADVMLRPQRWDLVTNEVFSVVGNEPLCPPKAAVQGVAKVLAQEYPSLMCAQVDLHLDGAEAPRATVGKLLEVLGQEPVERTVALRGRHRWVPTYVPCDLPPLAAPAVRRNGVYLITGGLGKIGLLMARALAEREPVRLVLTGRTGLPPRADWDDPEHPARIRSAIEAVRAIGGLGSEVMVAAADVIDARAMGALKEAVLRRFGAFDGVLHCAGTTGPAAHRSVSELGDDESAWHFGPKLYGPLVLEDMLADQRLDFALLSSSISAILGGLGFGAYASANAVLDVFAQRHHCADRPWSSINWDAWLFTQRAQDDSGFGAAIRELALTPEEGRRAFDELLNTSPQPHLVVSTADVEHRRRLWAAGPVEDAPSATRRHERPTLRNPYVAPSSDTEEQVAEIWQGLLGLKSVGVHDNFFELGGSSLLGLQVVHRLRQDLAVAVPLTIVYEGPTVRMLSRLIDGLGESL
ncbi:beta-ketoacyl synthase N-terminal-like domain-containing protein [Streptomyces sp. NPDC000941]